jgi:hypothetical protein
MDQADSLGQDRHVIWDGVGWNLNFPQLHRRAHSQGEMENPERLAEQLYIAPQPLTLSWVITHTLACYRIRITCGIWQREYDRDFSFTVCLQVDRQSRFKLANHFFICLNRNWQKHPPIVFG